jgi:siderophore synthetase component
MEKATNTSEFWVTAFVNVVMAVVAILAARGVVSNDEGALWVSLAESIAAVVAPLVMGWVSKSYVEGRTQLRVASLR